MAFRVKLEYTYFIDLFNFIGLMKKVIMSMAMVAMMVAAVACGNNANKKAQETEEATETVEEAKDSAAVVEDKTDSSAVEATDAAATEVAE